MLHRTAQLETQLAAMSASHQQQLGHAAGASQYDSALAKRLDSLEQRMATSESTVAEQAALMLTPEMVERLEDEIARLDREREDATTQLEDQLYAYMDASVERGVRRILSRRPARFFGAWLAHTRMARTNRLEQHLAEQAEAKLSSVKGATQAQQLALVAVREEALGALRGVEAVQGLTDDLRLAECEHAKLMASVGTRMEALDTEVDAFMGTAEQSNASLRQELQALQAAAAEDRWQMRELWEQERKANAESAAAQRREGAAAVAVVEKRCEHTSAALTGQLAGTMQQLEEEIRASHKVRLIRGLPR